MQLGLSLPNTWGGRRKGAGRKSTGRLSHVERPWHDRTWPVHVTVPIVHGLRLRDLVVAREIGAAFRAMVGGKRESDFRVVAFSIQSDHVHLLVEARDRDALSRGMRAVTIRIAKAVNRALGRSGPVIRDRFHAHQLKSPTEARNALRYVLDNGRKHGAPEHEFLDGLDTRSSARYFARRDPASPVSAPRTYFLRAGYRRAQPQPKPGTWPGQITYTTVPKPKL